MKLAVLEILNTHGGFATTRQLLTVLTRKELDAVIRTGELVRIWYGVYGHPGMSTVERFRALSPLIDEEPVACLGTAAAMYGFDVENTIAVHVLDPGTRMRPTVGLMVHQRIGAPLRRVAGNLATAPAWTAIEVARQLPRPRALATLDATLRSGHCTLDQLRHAINEQRGRRGIVAVRELLQYADGRAESAMESEARLVMIDRDLPRPELQYAVIGLDGETYRADFAWPEALLIAEYESIEWHSGPAEMLRDRKRLAALQELGWVVVPIVVSDVRQYPDRLVQRLRTHLSSPSRHRIA
ncbi:MAG TPA: hypothetical protein VFW21_13055 [Mycobacterium sp.]|nr:hypothetical protein [Mycobacterium sp.]